MDETGREAPDPGADANAPAPGRAVDFSVLDVAAARRVLAGPFVTGEDIARLISQQALASNYELQRLVAQHPRTPQSVALALVAGLFWSDLVRLGADAQVRPAVRRAADQRLLEKLPSLAVGERIAIARVAGTAVLMQLRHDPTPRVIEALLENPRLTEGLVVPLVASERAAPTVLALVAGNGRWANRYEVRVALARNPRTPVASALQLLPLLRKADLQAITRDPRVAAAVQRRAQLLLGAA